MIWFSILSATVGFVADFFLGDPRCIMHPVVLIGKLISAMENMCARLFPKVPKWEFAGGLITAFVVIILSFAVPFFILFICFKISIYLAFAVNTFFSYQIYAAKSLKDESMRVFSYVEKGDIENARKSLSYIVGRDTETLSFESIDKAVVETVAENSSDGVIAPMLYMFLGLSPLGFLYKAVNTLDSMIGYKNEKYFYFGKAAAKIDDAFNFIPSRLAALISILTAKIMPDFNGHKAVEIFLRDRKKHSSPNSAQTEAVYAGAMEIQLAGDAYYFGKLYKKEYIGDNIRKIESVHILRSIKLMYGASVMSLAIFTTASIFAVLVKNLL